MAGHSKWSNIKERKGKADKQRSKIFSRIIKEIYIAIKENGQNGDPDTNPALRTALQNAKGANMPKDNIERAIKKASGAGAESYEQMTFEGYGPNGIAIYVECTSDNSNRTVSNIRAIFNKHNGSLGTNGSLEFLFDRLGVFTIDKANLEMDWEELQLELIEHGGDTFEEEEEDYYIYSNFTDYGSVSQKLEELGVEPKSTALERVPHHEEELPLDQALAIVKMLEAFEADDDVQQVFHNMKLTDELEAELSK